MAKIVELEKQLMQRNKELDVIRVSATGRLWLMPRLSGGICCAFLVWEVMTVLMGWAISVSFLIWNLEQISSRFIWLCSQRWTFNALSVPANWWTRQAYPIAQVCGIAGWVLHMWLAPEEGLRWNWSLWDSGSTASSTACFLCTIQTFWSVGETPYGSISAHKQPATSKASDTPS